MEGVQVKKSSEGSMRYRGGIHSWHKKVDFSTVVQIRTTIMVDRDLTGMVGVTMVSTYNPEEGMRQMITGIMVEFTANKTD